MTNDTVITEAVDEPPGPERATDPAAEFAPAALTDPMQVLIEQGGVLRLPEDATTDPNLADASFGDGVTIRFKRVRPEFIVR